MDEELKTRRRAHRSQPGRDSGDAVALDELLVAHCRNAMTDLPRGVLGTSTAVDLLRVLPTASRLGLPDITGYGSELFAPLVEHGLLPAVPSPRVVPAALALVARVSPLVEARSARTWTLWLARVRAPGSAVAKAVVAVTPSSDVAVVPVTTPSQARRAAASPDEPNRTATPLASSPAESPSSPAESPYSPAESSSSPAESSSSPSTAESPSSLAESPSSPAESSSSPSPAESSSSPAESPSSPAESSRSTDELAEIRRLFGIPDTDDRPLVEILKPIMSNMLTIAEEAMATEQELLSLQERAEAAERDLEVARTILGSLGLNLADLMHLVPPTAAPPDAPSAAQEELPDAPSIGGPDEGRYYRRVIRTDGEPTYWKPLFPRLPPEESPSRWPGRKPRDKG